MKLLAFALIAAAIGAWVVKSLWTRAIELWEERMHYNYEPRVGTPERLEWQRRKNAEAMAAMNAVPMAPKYDAMDDFDTRR